VAAKAWIGSEDSARSGLHTRYRASVNRRRSITSLTDQARPTLWRVRRFNAPDLLLGLGLVALALPTILDVARESWTTEQGAHGPIVLVTGIWLLVRELRSGPLRIKPGSWLLTLVALIPLLGVYCLARISGIIEIEGFVMYASLITIAYGLWGGQALKRIWFPLIYLLFIFPPPNTVFAVVTQPLKILISQLAFHCLDAFHYPIAESGVVIQIGPYQMLVAAACAGLNSLISLTALGLFYTYIRHRSNFAYMLFLAFCILPISIIANLVRVLLLLLITYHFGEAAGQGFFHELAGVSMFGTALLCIFGVDRAATSMLTLRARKEQANE
jgi:exosortase